MDRQELTQILVTRAQEGDRQAFGELFERYRCRLASLIQSRLGAELGKQTEVEDLVQEVFLRAFFSLARFRWAGDEALFRWLSVIARHVIQEAARRAGRELLLPAEHEVSSGEIPAARKIQRQERFARLESALETLKPEHRQVIVLTRIQRKPVNEVAEQMGRTPKATSQLLIRALEKLKEAFGHTESLSLPQEGLRGGRSDDE